MRIAVISDSHGNIKDIGKIFEKNKFDYLFFLGDGIGDIRDYINKENVFAVSGNCDFFSSVPNELYLELEGKKIFITHGNKYGVKSGIEELVEKGLKENQDFVFYGHTHKQAVIQRENMYVINPGSFKRDYFHSPVGLIVEIGEGVKISLLEID